MLRGGLALMHGLARYHNSVQAVGLPTIRQFQLKPLSAFHTAACAARKTQLLPHRQLVGNAPFTRSASGCSPCSTATEAVSELETERQGAGHPSHNIVQILRARGLLQEVSSPGLEKLAAQTTFPVYCGFDPTAASLHLGNLLGIVVLRWFAICGHTPIALLGGATGRVGDPSGKSAERPVLSEEHIEQNVQSIQALLERLLAQRGGQGGQQGGQQDVAKPLLLNNLDWFGAMPLLTFLRQVGKYARLGPMLAKDSVRSRMDSDSGISYTEFTYQLLQGYDFVHLQRQHGCRVQIGGSDQWGNITAGTDLIRRLGSEDGREPPQCFGLTFPLLTSSDGKKWGKSEGGALWLSAEKMSPFKLYQYLLKNTTDQDVIRLQNFPAWDRHISHFALSAHSCVSAALLDLVWLRYLKMLTFLPLGRIDAIQADMQHDTYQPNTAQRLLAEEVIRFVHGEEGLSAALSATQALRPGAATALDAATLEAIAGDVPSAALERGQVVDQALVQVMVATGLQPNKSASKRMIKGGGVQVNNVRIGSEEHKLNETDLIEGRLLLLTAGKKNKMLVTVT